MTPVGVVTLRLRTGELMEAGLENEKHKPVIKETRCSCRRGIQFIRTTLKMFLLLNFLHVHMYAGVSVWADVCICVNRCVESRVKPEM